MTTGGGSVHFNPNLYSCGKVCLSILGTWSGPAWTPVQNLTSVLLSIQSLLSTDPYYNEPGVPRNVVASEQYSDYVRHETMRVAVLDMVGDTSLARSMPPKLLSVARSLFIAHFPVYRDTCEEHAKRNPEGAAFADPLGRTTGTFCWRGLGSRLAAVGSRLGAANFEPEAERSERDAEGEGGGQGGISVVLAQKCVWFLPMHCVFCIFCIRTDLHYNCITTAFADCISLHYAILHFLHFARVCRQPRASSLSLHSRHDAPRAPVSAAGVLRHAAQRQGQH